VNSSLLSSFLDGKVYTTSEGTHLARDHSGTSEITENEDIQQISNTAASRTRLCGIKLQDFSTLGYEVARKAALSSIKRPTAAAYHSREYGLTYNSPQEFFNAMDYNDTAISV
jgi:hypothetical protein